MRRGRQENQTQKPKNDALQEGKKFIASFSPSQKRERQLPELLPWDEFKDLYMREEENWEFRVKTVIANSGGKSYTLLLQVISSPRQVNAYAKLRVIPDIAIAILRSKVEVFAKWDWETETFLFYEGDETGSWEKGRTAIGTAIWRWKSDDIPL